jgi:hypothetical protein
MIRIRYGADTYDTDTPESGTLSGQSAVEKKSENKCEFC